VRVRLPIPGGGSMLSRDVISVCVRRGLDPPLFGVNGCSAIPAHAVIVRD